ncbi:MAG: sensor histidine kinase, partial [Sphingobacteriia bacterium]
YYMAATALLMALAFVALYLGVRHAVIRNLDELLAYEAEKHLAEVEAGSTGLYFRNRQELEEREHREIQTNPIFIQLMSTKGKVMDRSPNLKEYFLKLDTLARQRYRNAELGHTAIRQIQVPVLQQGRVQGYLLAALSLQSARSILLQLGQILVLAYVLLLLGSYAVSRFLAGRSIRPIQKMTDTLSHLSRQDLQRRVPLPEHRDELYRLATSFNDLLDRIEQAMQRERQFTSDASHELRTPLSVLRGTLEVLIRRQRSATDYEEKIRYCLGEIDRMTRITDQLLLLARLEQGEDLRAEAWSELPSLIDETLCLLQAPIQEKGLQVRYTLAEPAVGHHMAVPHSYTRFILDNVIGNAVKYAYSGTPLTIDLSLADTGPVCRIQDAGVGIREEDLKQVFDSFYRSDAMTNRHISGHGLGLSVVKKCADAIGARVEIQSRQGLGTTVTLFFTKLNQADTGLGAHTRSPEKI